MLEMGGGLLPRRELGGRASSALSVKVVWMCRLSDVPSGVGERVLYSEL